MPRDCRLQPASYGRGDAAYTDGFDGWFDALGKGAKEDVALAVKKLE